MSEVIEAFTPWIEVLENAIKNDENCPTSFEEQFCDGNQLLEVWFNSDRFKVIFVESSGEIITKTFFLQSLSEWLLK